MTAAGRFGAGFLGGVLIAGILSLFLGDGSIEAVAPTSTAPAVTVAAEAATEPWIEPGETLIGTTVILPRDLTVEDAVAYFDYDLAGLGPTLRGGGEEVVPGGDYLARPERWVLTTKSGQEVEAETGPNDTSVRFDLPSSEEEVASISLVDWRIPIPADERVDLPAEAGASATIRRGTVNIETVLEQSISTIIQIDFDSVGGPWQGGVVLRPVDPRWRTTGRQGGGIQLIWDGTDAPSRVVVDDVGFEMRPVAGDLAVWEADQP